MATKTIERKVTFRERDLPAFLDMLRYDACTVVGWDRGGAGGQYVVTLRSMPGRTTGYEFTSQRWESFGLYLTSAEAR
jgi:hypothetical protein